MHPPHVSRGDRIGVPESFAEDRDQTRQRASCAHGDDVHAAESDGVRKLASARLGLFHISDKEVESCVP
jgi:hypothetical protein